MNPLTSANAPQFAVKKTTDDELLTKYPVFNPMSYGAVGDGVADDTNEVNLAIAAALAANGQVLFPHGYTFKVVGAGVSTSDVTFVFAGGVVNVITSTWTVNGSFVAPPRAIISSSIPTPVLFNRGAGSYSGQGTGIKTASIWVEWFGANGVDGTSDNALALSQWLASAGNGMTLEMAGGKYATLTQVDFPSGKRFNVIEGNNSKIIWTGGVDATKAILRFSATPSNRIEFRNITFDADSKAGFGVLVSNAAANLSINSARWVNCGFDHATVCNTQIGQQTTTTFTVDAACWVFEWCWWHGILGSTNIELDATEVVNCDFRSCQIGYVSTTDLPTYNVRLLKGGNASFRTCFFDRVALPGYSIYNTGYTLKIDGCDCETVRFLWQETTLEKTNLITTINSLRLVNAGSVAVDGELAIYAPSGIVSIDGMQLIQGAIRLGVRVDSKLSIKGSFLAGEFPSSVPTGGDIIMANPQRCDIDGTNPAECGKRALNSNPYLSLWSGSASNDLPIGYSMSASGTATVTRAGISSAEWPKTGFGRYCAKVVVTVGAVSGSVIDGLMCRVCVDSRRGPGPIVVMVSGFAESMTGATAPKVGINANSWGGAAWTVIPTTPRTCSIDSAGRFWGVATILVSPSNVEVGYVDCYVGMGVAGATGTLYISEMIVLPDDGLNWFDSSAGNYPGFGRLKALSVTPKVANRNGSFAQSSHWWTVGAGWTVSGGVALHAAAGGTAVLSQDVGYNFKTRRCLLAFTVASRTAGTVTPYLCGTTGTAVSANGQQIVEIISSTTDQLLSFIPTTDFDGSVTDIKLYMVQQNGDPIDGSSWAKAGQLALSTNGVDVVAGGADVNINPRRLISASAAPTIGTWKVGDVVLNSAPATGGVTRWSCTVSGTPGTWVAEFDLNVLGITDETYSGRTFAKLAAIGTNISVVLAPTGTGYISAQMPDGTATGGNQRGNYSVDLTFSRSVATKVASGVGSFAAGADAGATGNGSWAFGQSGGTTIASGTNSIAFGYNNSSSGDSSISIGNLCIASGNYGSVAIGYATNATGVSSLATGDRTSAPLTGQHAHGSGNFAGVGDAQISRLVARRATAADATPVNLFLDGSSARLTIPANTAWAADITIIARTTTAGAAYAVFRRQVVVWRGVAVGTTVCSTAVTIGTDQGSNATLPPVGWAVAITGDAVNGALDIQCTGSAAAGAARWVAQVTLTEVAYA